jgi:hypothetical protein
MRGFLLFVATIFIWIYMTMPDVRREGQQRAVDFISETVRG